eukprot:7251091-Pyramimonas_sp.AAC.1
MASDRNPRPHARLDEEGIPRFDGDAAAAEEWDERARLGFPRMESIEKKKGFIAKVKNDSSGERG